MTAIREPSVENAGDSPRPNVATARPVPVSSVIFPYEDATNTTAGASAPRDTRRW